MARAKSRHAAPDDGARLSESQRLDWLQLIRSENVGPVTFRELINHYGSASTALEALPELSHRGGRKRVIKIASRARVERELEAARRMGSEAVVAGEAGYPSWLEHADGGPPVLYVVGRRDLSKERIVGIVGSRDGSAAGRKLARSLAGDLGKAGYVISSGLARGIDGEAHAASLDTGTIAVVAGGLDVIYPPEHEALHHAIAERGLIVSECPPGQVPRAQDFPRRNRIISGMASGIIVVEAARRSGTLITARMAAEQGRQVFAVPGHPLDPRAVGTNMLLRQGATLITSADDVIEALRPIDPRVALARAANEIRSAPVQGGLFDVVDTDPIPETVPEDVRPEFAQACTSERDRILNVLGTTPIEIDEICRTSESHVRTVRAVLLELDLAGRLERHQNQLVSVRP